MEGWGITAGAARPGQGERPWGASSPTSSSARASPTASWLSPGVLVSLQAHEVSGLLPPGGGQHAGVGVSGVGWLRRLAHGLARGAGRPSGEPHGGQEGRRVGVPERGAGREQWEGPAREAELLQLSLLKAL